MQVPLIENHFFQVFPIKFQHPSALNICKLLLCVTLFVLFIISEIFKPSLYSLGAKSAFIFPSAHSSFGLPIRILLFFLT